MPEIERPTHAQRKYHRWVADETLEDYALRYAPQSFRRWSEFLIANTAIGSIAFLALEAIGASIALHYGFSTAFWAILVASLLIFITALPISYYAARYNVDIDLLTRGAGFGYIGSTITSLIYASFSFIFFALEAAIMAQAIYIFTGLPLSWAYLISALIIIPIVFRGITCINRLQLWTQPIWIILMILPFVLVLYHEPQAIEQLLQLQGDTWPSHEFNPYYFGFALGVSLSLIAQVGEQADYLRFMPPLTEKNRWRWWAMLLLAGPGWVILGFLKQLGGMLLAAVALLAGASIYEAKTPIQMYYTAYQYVIDNPNHALSLATVFIIISQIKINVTNAYAGSLAWSNFFSRVAHFHPGRVVWLVFNILIALVLMELGVFDALEMVLGLYANIAIAWITTLFADLTINKPLKLSPSFIEFKRAYLYNFNPVGVVSMGAASILSILAFTGLFGAWAQSYASLIAMITALLLTPIMAWLTKGRYYIARVNPFRKANTLYYICQVCNHAYEKNDMAYCDFHKVSICSLCCSLDNLCQDSCKKYSEEILRIKVGRLFSRLLGERISFETALRFFSFGLLTALISFVLGILLWTIYQYHAQHVSLTAALHLKKVLIAVYFVIVLLISILIWWIVLIQSSKRLVEEHLEEKTRNLDASRKAILKQKKELEAHKELYELVFKNTTNGVLIIDVAENRFVNCNQAAVKMLGFQSRKDILNSEPADLSPEYQPDGQRSDEKSYALLALAVKQGSINFEWKYLNRRHQEIWVEVMMTSIVLNGKPMLHVVWKDIDHRKKAEEQLLRQKQSLAHQAHHDALTGLPNRTLFYQRFQQALERAEQQNKKLALFFIDLDRFKQINDTLGHAMGDEVLKAVSKRIQTLILGHQAVLARLGGDEFVLLLEDLQNKETAAKLAQDIVKNLVKPIISGEHSMQISSSIGISLYPEHHTEMDKLFLYADLAMYKAKDSGRNNFQFYTADMGE